LSSRPNNERSTQQSQWRLVGECDRGSAALVVCDTSIVQSIYGAIQEYAGFERPEWLG
jgi:hypothetical protein